MFERFAARAVILVGHSGGATIAANILGRHPDVADAALLVACGCGPTRSLQPLELAPTVRKNVIVRLVAGAEDDTTPPRIMFQPVVFEAFERLLAVPALAHR